MPMPLRTLIHLSLAPYGLHPGMPAASKDGRFIAVPCQDSHNLVVLDGQRLEIIDVLPLRIGSSPSVAAISDDNAYCAVSLSEYSPQETKAGNSTVAIVDLNSPRLLGEYEVGAGPNGLLFLRDGPRHNLIVANTRSASLSVLDVNQNFDLLGTIKVGAGAFSVMPLPNPAEVAVANFVDASVSVANVQNFAVRFTTVVGDPALNQPNPEWGHGDTTWVTASDKSRLVAANWRSSTLVELDLETGEIVRRAPSPSPQPFFLNRSPTNSSLVVASSPAREVRTVSMATLRSADVLGLYSLGYPLADLLTFNSVMNDPDDHSIAIFAPKGVGGLRTMTFERAGPL